MLAFYILFLLFSLYHEVAATCPRKCNCDLSRRVQCYRIGQMPKEIASTTRQLYISHSKIKQLQISDVNQMSALEEFILTSSGTEAVERNTFKALAALRILELWKNKLRCIPTLLPANLEVLKLGDNLISVLNESDFEGLKRLRVLDIQNNLILALSSSTLSSLSRLQSLILDGNNMESVSGPLSLHNLKYLSMANNKLQKFPGRFFTSLHILLFLNLNGNLLTTAPPDLPQSLLSLTLERNQLTMLKSEDMKKLANLSELCVSENQLSSIDEVQFISSLTRLEVAGNKLQTFPLHLPTALQKIDCSNNLIEKIKAHDFHDLQDLKHLFLDKNVVKTFEDGALQRCKLLSNLALEQNLLSSIPLSLPHTLARLDLKGNNIQRIQEQELKNLKQLQVLNLRNNKITALDHGLLEHLPRLKHLYLEGNLWNCTCDLFRTRRVLTAKGTDVKGGQCFAPAENKGESWMSSKRFLRLCIHDSLYAGEDSSKTRKKANADNPSTHMDDYYDYETD
ncbi:nephrocan-like [Sphaerodactylus townsendi]|uniref:nephrocan-like n=1 Tax=Sphaerodactylus townsendi TaxID=933632 RepID=UPI00202725B0|nr:nephrocan-like [Sphaerodactylus townsendi]